MISGNKIKVETVRPRETVIPAERKVERSAVERKDRETVR